MDSGRTSLGDITLQEINKAFLKTVEEIKPPVGKLVLVTKDVYQKALEIPKYFFYDEEPTGKSLNLQWTDDLENLWLYTFRANLSIMLVNEENGDIIGLRATKFIKKTDTFDIETIKDGDLRSIVNFMEQGVDEFYARYGIEEAFHFLGLGVAKKYRQRGIGHFLMETALKFLGNLNIRPCFIKGEGTSNYSKKIYEKCGFDIVGDYLFVDYKENGKVVIDNTGEHKSMKVYGKRMN